MTMASAATLTGTAPAPLSLKHGSGHRPRLLLAEDSDPVRIVTAAMLKSMGCVVEDFGNLPDSLDATRAALRKAGALHDLVITSGGVSVGEEDHVKPALEAEG